jgi:hypothetical protein
LNGLNKYNLKERSQIKEIPIINNNDDDISENKKEKQNENQNAYFFIYLWLTEIPAYIINLLINYFLRKMNYFSDYYMDFFIVSIIIFSIFAFISILIYCYYSRVFNKNKNSKKGVDIQFKRICGNIEENNNTDINESENITYLHKL